MNADAKAILGALKLCNGCGSLSDERPDWGPRLPSKALFGLLHLGHHALLGFYAAAVSPPPMDLNILDI